MLLSSVRARRAFAAAAATALAASLGTAVARTSHAASAPRAAATPTCRASDLAIWLDTVPNGAAGSAFYDLEFTNLSGHTCRLSGFPGVSAVDLKGHQLGSPAARDTTKRPVSVTVRNRGTATASLRIVEAGNFPSSSCRQTTAAGLRVFAPGERRAKLVPYPFAGCARAGERYLVVRPVRGGGSSIGGPAVSP